MDRLVPTNCWNMVDNLGKSKNCEADERGFSNSGEQTKKRVWEASCTSLKSKKVKGGHAIDCQSDARDSASGRDTRNNCPSISSVFIEGNKFLLDEDNLTNSLGKNDENCRPHNMTSKHHGSGELSKEKCFRVMLMNIADYKKKSALTKVCSNKQLMIFCGITCMGSTSIFPQLLEEK